MEEHKDSYWPGRACRLKEVVGRILSKSGGIIFMCTPHGTMIKTGCVWLNFFNEKDGDEYYDRLVEYEKDCVENDKPLYKGLLNDILGFSDDPLVEERLEVIKQECGEDG